MEVKFLRAYTILELVIVMSVIAVMMGLGIVGLTTFKRNAEFNSSYTSLVTNIRSIQSRARNSVSEDSGVTPTDFYGIFFTQNQYFSYRCIRVTNNLNCSKTVRLFQDTSLLNATFTFGNCRNVLFERLTGRLYSVQYTGQLTDAIITGLPSKTSSQCTFVLNGGNGDSKDMIFNLVTNQVSFE